VPLLSHINEISVPQIVIIITWLNWPIIITLESSYFAPLFFDIFAYKRLHCLSQRWNNNNIEMKREEGRTSDKESDYPCISPLFDNIEDKYHA